MNEPKDHKVLSSQDALPLEADIPEENSGEFLLDDDSDEILFAKAEVVAPDDVEEVLRHSSGEHAAAWSNGKLRPSSGELRSSVLSRDESPHPETASGLMDTVVDDDPETLQRLREQSEATPQQEQSVMPKNNGGLGILEGSRSSLPSAEQSKQNDPSSSRMLVYSHSQDEMITPHIGSSSSYALVPEARTSPGAASQSGMSGSQSHVDAWGGNHTPSVEDHHGVMAVNSSGVHPADDFQGSRDSLHNMSISQAQETYDEAAHSQPSLEGRAPEQHESERSQWKMPQVDSGNDWDDDDPGERNMMGSSLPSADFQAHSSVETLPIYAMGHLSGEELKLRGGIGDQHQQQFEDVIDTLSREGIGSRESVRDDLRKITAAHYELLRSSGIDLPQSYRTMIAEEQEAVWEQLCAHVDLYKDFLYQLFGELEQWHLSDDCCPNLLCRSPRESGQSICRRCQSEFFLVCPHCKSQTPYFSERCQQIQCGKLLPPEEKLTAAVKITNAYAQRQGKASVAAAAAFVLYYLMERFSITTKGDWFHQIDRYRKLQGKVNEEYQRRCLAAYQDELLRILSPALEHLRQGILRQVNELYAERRFVDSLDTLNSMPAVLQNTQIEEIRHRIYERLTEAELNRIESLMQEGKLQQAQELLENLSFESPRRQMLMLRCQQILAERQRSQRVERWEGFGNGVFVLLLVAGSVFHWLAMPAFLGKDSVGWVAPYLLLVGSGIWLLRRRTVVPERVQWLLGQTVTVMAAFGGVLFVLLGLLFCSWYLTVPDPLQGVHLLPGYRLAPPHANILPAYTSWRIVYHIAVVGGLMGLLAGGLVGAGLGFSASKRKFLFSTLVGAVGVCLGVALISSIGVTVGSAISVMIVNTVAAAIAVAAITALMVSLGVEVGLKIAADMEFQQLVWGGIVGALAGALIGALFGAGVVHNGMTKMQLIHADVAWAGLPLATGVLGAILFVVAMFRWGGIYFRILRWTGVVLLFVGSLSVWLTV